MLHPGFPRPAAPFPAQLYKQGQSAAADQEGL